MPHIMLHRCFRRLALIVAVFTVIASYQISSAQTAAPPTPEYIRFLEEQSMLFQADQ